MGDQSTLPTINFLSLNVCGVNRKLQYKEFIDLLSLYDLIGLSETKTDECDAINLPGYSVFFKNRCKLSKVRSGGIAVLVKDHIVK